MIDYELIENIVLAYAFLRDQDEHTTLCQYIAEVNDLASVTCDSIYDVHREVQAHWVNWLKSVVAAAG